MLPPVRDRRRICSFVAEHTTENDHTQLKNGRYRQFFVFDMIE